MSDLRLAALTSHPIQYQAPLFREIDNRDGIDLTVYFCSRQGIKPTTDEGFGQEVVWDVPLLNGYEYEFVPDRSPFGGAESFLRFNPGIVGPLRRGEHDALWVQGYESLTNITALVAANHYDIPVIFRGEVMPWAVRGSAKRFLVGKLLDRVDAFASIGTPNRKVYESFRISEDRIFHAPYSVDNEFFQKQRERLPPVSELREAEGIPVSRPVVLFVGKFVRRKRPGLLLEAFIETTEPGEATLLYVGDGELRSDIGRRAAEHDRGEDVIFAGFVNQSEISRYYELADVFALPSVRENWGLVINEAMNFRLPIITTKAVGASRDLVSDENGIVAVPDERAPLVTGVRRFLNNSEQEHAGQRSLELISDWGTELTADGIIHATLSVAGETR